MAQWIALALCVAAAGCEGAVLVTQTAPSPVVPLSPTRRITVPPYLAPTSQAMAPAYLIR